jgi:SPOR domain
VARFFFGAAVGGRLRLRDIHDWSYWNAHSIAYWDESHIDGVSRLTLVGRKVRSADELDDAITASIDLPGIEGLWIHERLLGEVRARWKQARRSVKNRLELRAPAAAAAVFAAAFCTGFFIAAQHPTKFAERRPAPAGRPRTDAARPAAVGPHPGRTGAEALGRISPPSHLAAAEYPPVPPIRAAYAVTIGTYANQANANQVKHFAQRKGYIVRVVPRGALTEVVTPPYASKAQAERVVRGFAAIGLPAHLTSWDGI